MERKAKKIMRDQSDIMFDVANTHTQTLYVCGEKNRMRGKGSERRRSIQVN
jgi:hypothetical protein